MTDKDQAAAPYPNGGNGLPGRLGPYETYDDFPADEDWPAGAGTGLVSLSFLTAAIRRSAGLICLLALVGLLAGIGFYLTFPAPYQATTSVMLTYGPYETTGSAASDYQAIAQTGTAAGMAMRKLGLRGNVGGFLSEYTVTAVSNRVLLITFSAPSAVRATRGANAVATELLRLRAGQLEQLQQQRLTALEQQYSKADQNYRSLSAQFRRLESQPYSSARQSRLSALWPELQTATDTAGNLRSAVNGVQATDQPATAAAVKDSRVLDAAALQPRAQLKHLLLYAGIGLVVGLAVAIAIVLIRAIVSDRLRRRDEVADALGAPVKVSTGPLRARRPLPGFRPASAAAAREASIQRIAAHLGRTVPANPQGVPALAVVAVDDPEAAALPLVSLATSWAGQDQRVVLADLASGAPAARLLGTGGRPGVDMVSAQDARLVVAVPERGDVTPAGPFGRTAAREQRSPFTDAVAAAVARADVLLTLVTLDPSSGGEHLATWAVDAVAVVTAGRSSWTKINAVGEMVRLSGARLVSAVLIGADKTDESLGRASTQAGRGTAIVEQGPDGHGSRLAADEMQGRRRSATGDIPR